MPKAKSEITTDLYTSLRSRAAAAGISLSEACRRAGVDRNSIGKWRNQVPKSIDMLNRLNEVIENAKN